MVFAYNVYCIKHRGLSTLNIEKTVFISYRRTNSYTALAVYQHLMENGYDCFMDVETLDSGAFDQIILRQIEARAHFIIVLTPSALERCSEPGDWLQREIEHAIDHQRNIVPLMFEGFDFRDVNQYLTGKLSALSTYNAVRVPVDYFEAAMNRMQTRFLNVPLEMVIHPTPPQDEQVVQRKQAEAASTPTLTEAQLTAEEYYERGLKRDKTDYDGKIVDYSEAIRLNPQYAKAYYNRALVYDKLGDRDREIADYEAALRIDPNYELAKKNLDIARRQQARGE